MNRQSTQNILTGRTDGRRNNFPIGILRGGAPFGRRAGGRTDGRTTALRRRSEAIPLDFPIRADVRSREEEEEEAAAAAATAAVQSRLGSRGGHT